MNDLAQSCLDNFRDPKDTNCAPLVANLFLFCYERGLMLSLSGDKQADIIEAFNNTSRYVDFDNMEGKIYPST